MTQTSSSPPPARKPVRWFRWFLFLLFIGAAIWLWRSWFMVPEVPERAVLVLDLLDGVAERSKTQLADYLFGGGEEDLVSISRALHRAEGDPRVKGLLLRVGAPEIGFGRVEELRAMLGRFKEKGRFVVSVLESPDTLGYFLAAAADTIYLERVSELSLVGLELQAYFIGESLRRYGIEADMLRVGEYKGAFEELTGSSASSKLKEALEANIEALYKTLIEAIAAARKLPEDRVRALIDSGPFSSERALKEGLVDQLVYRDEIPGLITARCGGAAAEELSVGDYVKRTSSFREGQIGLVHVQGLLVDRQGSGIHWLGRLAGADRVREALRAAREDSKIKAVIVRIDSPGGTLSAAEAIWREIRLTHDQKPVVASMGETAASGGYYIAAAADRALAHGGTITGSIGIFGGKLVVEDLLKEKKVAVETVSRGAHAEMEGFHRKFSEEERKVLEGLLKEGYQLFVQRVAEGRKKSFEEAERAAQGRVWTGREAMALGLIDGLGGLDESLKSACGLAGIDPAEAGEPVIFPPEKGLLELLSAGEENSRMLRLAGARSEGGILAIKPSEVLKSLEALGLTNGRHRLALLPLVFKVR
ncbi:MAG: signal peptide peptidase SppA [Planctomycetes bacterium]|nr:signal peptide peptidase SppA [Planctomycetota bacterium]